MHYQYETNRGIRRSPFYDRLVDLGAVHGEVTGWERPNWYAPDGADPKYEHTHGRPNWFEFAASEHNCIRKNVGFYDLTSLAKFRVSGRDAEHLLQRLCCADIAVPVGKLVNTQWLNERGGIEASLTVARMGTEEFVVATACESHVKDWAWLNRHVEEGMSVEIEDITAELAVVALQGPNSRAVFQNLTEVDLSPDAFPFGTGRWMKAGGVDIWAQRISYVGELGWEIYIPTADALAFLDALLSAGKPFEILPIGMQVVDALRLEKGFRHWGRDIKHEDNLVEAGLACTARPGKSIPFIGRDAFVSQKEAGVQGKRLVSFLLQHAKSMLFHNQPISRDGETVGYLTSGNYSHYFGNAIGMGYVNADVPVSSQFIHSGQFTIRTNGLDVLALPKLGALYDPTSARMHS